jgi:hypothetical protein
LIETGQQGSSIGQKEAVFFLSDQELSNASRSGRFVLSSHSPERIHLHRLYLPLLDGQPAWAKPISLGLRRVNRSARIRFLSECRQRRQQEQRHSEILQVPSERFQILTAFLGDLSATFANSAVKSF